MESESTAVLIIALPPAEDAQDGKKQWEILATSADPAMLQQPWPQNDRLPLYNTADSASASVPPQSQPRRSGARRLRRLMLLFLFGGLLSFVFLEALPFMSSKLSEEQERKQDDEEFDVFPLFTKYGGIGDRFSMPAPSELIEMLVERDRLRNNKRKVRVMKMLTAVKKPVNATAIIPIKGNVHPDGLYFTNLFFGNPPRPYYLDVDTGSDLTWLQCDAPCTKCAQGPHPLYSPKGVLVNCKEPICSQVHQGSGSECSGSSQQCDYVVNYADFSSTMGVLMSDVLSLALTNRSYMHTRVTFGCAYDQQGSLAISPAKTDGLLGLSGSSVALPSQLAQKGIFRNIVGHCLAGGGEGNGYMFFGDNFIPTQGMTWVPMWGKPAVAQYYSALARLQYGSSSVSADRPGYNRAISFDSGTTFTYLMPNLYTELLSLVSKQTTLQQDLEDKTLPVCWKGPSPFSSVADASKYFKTLTFTFSAGTPWLPSTTKNMNLPPEGYLIINAQGNVCFAILDAGKLGHSIIGDVTLRGQLVVYDNEKKQIGWIRSKCEGNPKRAPVLLDPKLRN